MPKSKRKGRKLVEETLSPTDPALHHHISTETRNKVDIADFLDANEGDPALTVYLYSFTKTFCGAYIDFFMYIELHSSIN